LPSQSPIGSSSTKFFFSCFLLKLFAFIFFSYKCFFTMVVNIVCKKQVCKQKWKVYRGLKRGGRGEGCAIHCWLLLMDFCWVPTIAWRKLHWNTHMLDQSHKPCWTKTMFCYTWDECCKMGTTTVLVKVPNMLHG